MPCPEPGGGHEAAGNSRDARRRCGSRVAVTARAQQAERLRRVGVLMDQALDDTASSPRTAAFLRRAAAPRCQSFIATRNAPRTSAFMLDASHCPSMPASVPPPCTRTMARRSSAAWPRFRCIPAAAPGALALEVQGSRLLATRWLLSWEGSSGPRSCYAPEHHHWQTPRLHTLDARADRDDERPCDGEEWDMRSHPKRDTPAKPFAGSWSPCWRQPLVPVERCSRSRLRRPAKPGWPARGRGCRSGCVAVGEGGRSCCRRSLGDDGARERGFTAEHVRCRRDQRQRLPPGRGAWGGRYWSTRGEVHRRPSEALRKLRSRHEHGGARAVG